MPVVTVFACLLTLPCHSHCMFSSLLHYRNTTIAQAQKTDTIKRSSSSPVWGTSKVMQFQRPDNVVSCNILTFEVRHSALFVREGILGQGEVRLACMMSARRL